MRRVDRRCFRPFLVAAALLSCGPTSAQDANPLRPTGPVTIEADHADWVKEGAMVYQGNVRLHSGDLRLSGTRMEFQQTPDGHFTARLDGLPATLDHAALPTESGRPGPPVSARGKLMTYDSRSATVAIDGEALLTRGTDEIRGGNVTYDVTHRRIQANGGEGGQVRIVIQPPPAGEAEGSIAPIQPRNTPTP